MNSILQNMIREREELVIMSENSRLRRRWISTLIDTAVLLTSFGVIIFLLTIPHKTLWVEKIVNFLSS